MSTALISHDQGGAEILSRWAAINNDNFNFSLAGPAIKVFKNNYGLFENLEYKQAILKSELVICSTSWQSDLEKNAVKFAKENKKKVVSFLDHWVNFQERYLLNDIYYYPDEIWVCDQYAYKLASKIFKEIKLVLKRNYYLDNIFEEIKKIKKSQKKDTKRKNILYVGENIAEHNQKKYGEPNFLGYTEKDAFKYFLDNLNIFPEIEKIIIRPHPSENSNYKWAQKLSNLVEISPKENTLLEDILKSDIVIGSESMAMVVAIISSKKVVSIIPPKGRKCVLPHREILHLEKLIKDKSIIK